MGADVGPFNDELSVAIGFKFNPIPELLFCLFNAVLFKSLVDLEKFLFRKCRFEFPLPSPFEVYPTV